MTAAPTPVSVQSVYVHAPFCARRCFYCDFAVSVRREDGSEEWSRALVAEVELVGREGLLSMAPELRSLYVGGGTPSLLGPGAMAALADAIGRDRLGGEELEWTAEANPESFTAEVAEGWATAGVNRLSLGAQTFHEGALRWMGRLHDVDSPERAVEASRAAGVHNISVDLIFGLPGHLGRSWRQDLELALRLDVPHVSLYGLTVESGTPLGRAVAEEREAPVDDGQYEEEFLLAAEVLADAGYEHYEVSNFARSGARSWHNSVYWSGAPYLGLGNGAHSYAPPIRRWNVREWETYRALLSDGQSPERDRETVDEEATRLERIWLGLRTSEGLSVARDKVAARRLIDGWERDGLATRRDDTVRLTPAGWLLLDRIAVELDRVRDSK